MYMSYAEYLATTGSEDSRQSWIAWKVEICRMEPSEATKAAYDKEWGYEPLKERNR